MRWGKRNNIEKQWKKFCLKDSIPNLARLVQYTFSYSEANAIAEDNGLETRFYCDDDLKIFLEQAFKR